MEMDMEPEIDDNSGEILNEEPEIKLLRGMESRREHRMRLRNSIVSRFLEKKELADAAVIESRYYGELLAWALQRHIEVDGWKIISTVGYQVPKPQYIDVDTGCGKRENVLRDGTVFVEKKGDRFAVTVDASLRSSSAVVITGPRHRKEEIDKFANGVRAIVKKQNFYQGKKLEFGHRIRFLDLPTKMWESLVLDADMKNDMWANTLGFLANRQNLAQYGIPIKRGVLLVGEPGTGKTLACKALIAEATGITCLVASIDVLDEPAYIWELYELAQDLSPCMVFIEDVDLIAQERETFGYSRGSALLTLLSVLDGVEECNGVVTIATTNCQETLDKAISKRPSRFDRVIHFQRPSLKHRKELISLLRRKIPLDESVQCYLALKTANFTPAQIQEVIFSLAIGHCQNNNGGRQDKLEFSTEEVDCAISRISIRNRRHLGFTIPDNHNGNHATAEVNIRNETSVR